MVDAGRTKWPATTLSHDHVWGNLIFFSLLWLAAAASWQNAYSREKRHAEYRLIATASSTPTRTHTRIYTRTHTHTSTHTHRRRETKGNSFRLYSVTYTKQCRGTFSKSPKGLFASLVLDLMFWNYHSSNIFGMLDFETIKHANTHTSEHTHTHAQARTRKKEWMCISRLSKKNALEIRVWWIYQRWFFFWTSLHVDLSTMLSFNIYRSSLSEIMIYFHLFMLLLFWSH